MSTTIIQEFRADHQRIMGALVRLRQADLTPGGMPGVRRILGSTESLLGSHFKFEELHLYPAVAGFVGDEGVRRLVREHDSIFRGAGELATLAQKNAWSDADRNAALENLGLVGDHPENCDDLCRYIEQLPAGQQAALLDQMQTIRLQRPTFSSYAAERQQSQRG